MNKVKNIHGDNNVTSFDNFFFLCKIEEDKLREKVLKVKGLKKFAGRKGKFGKFGPQKRKKSIAEIQCYGCKMYEHYRKY